MRALLFPCLEIAHKENVSKLQLREKNSAVLAALIWNIRDWIYTVNSKSVVTLWRNLFFIIIKARSLKYLIKVCAFRKIIGFVGSY